MHVMQKVPGGVSGFFTGTDSALGSGSGSALDAGLVFGSSSSFAFALGSGLAAGTPVLVSGAT